MTIQRTWTPFQAGETVKESGMKIIQVVKIDPQQRHTHYEVEYLCCGKRDTKSHKDILKRVYAKYTRCVTCSRRASGKTRKRAPRNTKARMAANQEKLRESFAPGYHGWEPPPSAIKRAPRWL